eukprot:jgi/Undpi1/4886/HiC_scaffold_19.g08238.m1
MLSRRLLGRENATSFEASDGMTPHTLSTTGSNNLSEGRRGQGEAPPLAAMGDKPWAVAFTANVVTTLTSDRRQRRTFCSCCWNPAFTPERQRGNRRKEGGATAMKTRYQDHTVMVIPITRSVVFWEASEFGPGSIWTEAGRGGGGRRGRRFRHTISDAYAKRISGATLISLVNSDRLGELGISTLKRTQLLWNLERRIKLGDEKAGTAIDPRVFLGVEEHLQELQQPVDAHNQPYSDTPDEYDSSRYSDPSRRGARGGGMAAGGATGLGGGMPTGAGAGENGAGGGGGAGDLLDLMSMDMGVGASGESSERKVEGDAGADESKLLAIEDTPPPYGAGSDDASAAAAGALVLKKKKKKKSSSGGKKTFNLIDLGEEGGGVEGEVGEEEEEDEEEDEGGEEGEEVVYAEGGMGPQALVFEVVFPKGDTPNIMLEESQPGNKLSVKSFPKRSDGSTGTAEAGGRIEKGDYLVAVNSIRLEGFAFNDAIHILTTQGLERHAQLVTIARRTFWKKPVPLPPAPPHVAPGTAAMINGETSVCGWLLMKGPHDRESQRLFCDLHGNELLYHKPKGGVTGQTAGYNAAPAGSVDMSKVYLLSFAKDDALTQWMRKLNTAMIIGPGARTSGFREPSAPYMVSKSHRSLTVMWLPPRQPYLNSVHSFQVAYKNGINPLKDWTMATDEAHSTKFNIKGLKEGERYFVKVRAMHELDRGQMVWGDWSEHSRAFVTDKQAYRPTKPARHIWILVHGMRGDVDDMQYMAGCIRSRHGSDAHVVVAECNSAAFKTLDGISKGGTRLYEEAMQTIDSVPTAEYISFIGHGLGGIYARYALRLLNDASVFTDRLSPMNFITLGTPHLGSLMASGGTIGRMVDSETPDQLALKDTDMQRSRAEEGKEEEEEEEEEEEQEEEGAQSCPCGKCARVKLMVDGICLYKE